MKRHALIAGLLALPLAMAGATDFDTWAERLAAKRMRADPVSATVAQFFTGQEQDLLDGRIAPQTQASQRASAARSQAALQELARIDPQRLTPQQQVSAGIVRWTLQQEVINAEFLDNQYPFEHMDGLQVFLVNFVAYSHPLRHARDVQSYLSRLRAMGRAMDAGIAWSRASAARGVLMPRFITEKSIAEFESFLSPPAASNVLVVSLDERMAAIASLSERQRQAAHLQATRIVETSVLPAWRRGLALLRKQLPRTTDVAGVWRLPEGERYYAARLRAATTTDMTPAEIHQIGLTHVARIEAEMDVLLRQLGYDGGSINERYSRLEADQQPQSADPRVALMARYAELLRDAQERSKQYFDLMPKAAVEVRREPALTEGANFAHYTLATPDGSMPGIFWASLPGPVFPVVGMRTVLYHEAVPGHHLQLALLQEAQSLPHYQRAGAFYPGDAFGEGWGLYAEQLAADNGWYDGDPVGRIGQLSFALLRARRLVVDTGLHAMRWTRQQAIDYGASEMEVDRYIVAPGQACAYLIGRLHIEAQREKARRALGDRFDIRRFHNLVLATGDVPLQVLEAEVDRWVEAETQR